MCAICSPRSVIRNSPTLLAIEIVLDTLEKMRAVDNTARLFQSDQTSGPVEIEIVSVAKNYGDKQVLSDVSLAIHRGGCVALIGANGAGKSTLMRACAGLVSIDTGRLLILGHPLSGIDQKSLRRVRSQIGFVFQKHNLTPRLCALSNVIHGSLGRHWGPHLWSHHLAPRHLRKKALECLDQVGLADIASQRCDTLSGGQSQRVAIARMLMQKPKLIMADEPVASLDPSAGREVMELLVRLTKERGLTLLFSSHHLDHARAYAERIVALKSGKIIFDAAPAALSNKIIRDIYD